jgi:flagellar biosynthesis/type III secretory pathway protein FliH
MSLEGHHDTNAFPIDPAFVVGWSRIYFTLQDQDGYAQGYQDGYTTGYTDGLTAGYSSGYAAGYAAGLATGPGTPPPPEPTTEIELLDTVMSALNRLAQQFRSRD